MLVGARLIVASAAGGLERADLVISIDIVVVGQGLVAPCNRFKVLGMVSIVLKHTQRRSVWCEVALRPGWLLLFSESVIVHQGENILTHFVRSPGMLYWRWHEL